jgi:hypothetical protein
MPTSDRHWFLAGGRTAREASSLWTGDHSALKDLSVPLGLLRRAGRPVFFCPSKSAPAFLFVPSCSFLFPRGLCRDCWKVENRAQETAFPQVSDLREWSG